MSTHTIWLEDELNQRIATWVKLDNDQYFGGLSVPNNNGIIPLMGPHIWFTENGMLDMIAAIAGFAKGPRFWWLRSDGFNQFAIKPVMLASDIANVLQCEKAEVIAHYSNLVSVE